MTFQGLMTALVTPFVEGHIDEHRYRGLVTRQIDNNVDGLVPCGTTGEAPTLSVDEHVEIVRWTVDEAAGRVPVLAGIGSNSTATAIATGRAVESLGVQGVLATAPYYNKPTQEGLYQHFKAIADALSIEVCIYDVPGRSVVHVEPETIERLSVIENITCVKDATGDMANAAELRVRLGDRLALLSGDDCTTLPFLALGGHGVISVASNVAPANMKSLVDAARTGDLTQARQLSETLFPLFRDLFIESNPIPCKAAMSHMGLLADELRLPMTCMSDGKRRQLLETIAALGL
ncbi:MAG: 4-hydroxy-tetrahydrodipicolinate synthase [Myxococcota bacterium]